jgi:hypothetical protein
MSYEPIPVLEARAIAEKYGKDQVLVFAWDRESGHMHVTTYGKTLEDKEMAAAGGDRVAAILCDISQKVVFEDFRRKDFTQP